MVDGQLSCCVNHPSFEAVARCKMCGKPVCNTCVVSVASGKYCSETCQQKNDAFMNRAQELDRGTHYSTGGGKLGRMVKKLVILAIILVVIGFVSLKFNVPVLADLTRTIMGAIGL